MFLPSLIAVLLHLVPAAVVASAAPSAGASSASVALVDAGVAVAPDAAEVPAHPSAAPSVPAALAEPTSVDDALGKVTLVISLYKAGKWSALALLLINLLMFGFKKIASPATKSKWGSVVATGMGGVVASLSLVLAGSSWLEAGLIFAMGPASSVIYDLLKAVKPNKA